jgi:hypothetical protein
VRRAPDEQEQTLIVYGPATSQLTLERARASLDPDARSTAHTAPLALARDEPVRLRVFVDRTIVEVFANDTVSITTRIYSTRVDSLGVAVVAEQQTARLLRLHAWRMASIWEDSLTANATMPTSLVDCRARIADLEVHAAKPGVRPTTRRNKPDAPVVGRASAPGWRALK